MKGLTRLATVMVVASLPILGLSGGLATAGPKPKAGTPQILVTASPNPLVETATSNVAAIIQVEAKPNLAGNDVTISSTQLDNHCRATEFYSTADVSVPNSITLTLDNDGNATVYVIAQNCAPGPALISADVDAPPFATATTKLVILSPQVTPPGLHAFPNPEVEVGDASPSSSNAASEAAFVFYVETNPVFAEQAVTITSDQLTERCGQFSAWFDTNQNLLASNAGTAPSSGLIATEVNGIDNDGNAVFIFDGGSCAAGKSTVIADVQNGGPTYSTQVTIKPPAVTI